MVYLPMLFGRLFFVMLPRGRRCSLLLGHIVVMWLKEDEAVIIYNNKRAFFEKQIEW